MKRLLLLAVAALAVLPSLTEAQDRREGGGNPGGQRPGGGNPGGQRPGGGNPGGQRPGGGGPGGQRPGGNPGFQRPTPQPTRPGGDNRPDIPGGGVRPDRPGGDFNRPGRPGGDFNRPDRPGGDFNRPGRPGGDFNRPGRPGGDFNRPGRPGGDFHRPTGWRPPAGYWNGNRWGRPPIAWGGGYRFPNGYSYRRWSVGAFLPALLFSSAYYFNDYDTIGLYAPPYGYHWVRYGPDLLLVQNGTRRIVEVRYGVFR